MRALALLGAITLAVAACGGGSKSRADAAFLMASPAGLVTLDAQGRVIGRLVELPKDSAPASPSLFPDGSAIAFSITLPPKGATGFGSDIYAVNIDGTQLRPLVEHEHENVFYASPHVDPKGSAIYFHRRAAIIQNGTYVGNEDSIERLDLATKQRTRVVEGAADPALHPDGKSIAYVRYVDGQPRGLWRVGTDGRDPRPFFTIPDTWWYLQAPRFSPDGKTLIFSGAGHNAKVQAAPHGLAHLGIPSELYAAAADGSSVRAVAQTSDDVVPAWSPDGAQIAFIGLGALNVVALADGNVRQLSRGNDFFFGDLIWLRH